MSHQALQKRFYRQYREEGGKSSEEAVASIFDDLLAFIRGIMETVCPATSVKKLAKEHPVYFQGECRRKLVDDGYPFAEARKLAAAARETVKSTSAKALESDD